METSLRERLTGLTVDHLIARLETLEREHARLQREYTFLGAQLRAALERRPGLHRVAPQPGREAAQPGDLTPPPPVDAPSDDLSPGLG